MNNYERRPYTFDRVVRILFSVCALLATLYLLTILKGVLLPFLVACLIAYMLEPVVKWNQKWMHTDNRFLPVMTTLIETCIVIGGFCAIFFPYLISECAHMTEMVKTYATKQMDIPFISESIHRFIRDNIDFNQLSKLLSQEQWEKIIKTSVSSSWSFLSSSLAFLFGVISWLVVILYVIFIMLDYEKLTLSFRQLVPHSHRRRVFRIFDDIKNAMNRYFRGQFLIAFIVGILFSIGFVI